MRLPAAEDDSLATPLVNRTASSRVIEGNVNRQSLESCRTARYSSQRSETHDATIPGTGIIRAETGEQLNELALIFLGPPPLKRGCVDSEQS